MRRLFVFPGSPPVRRTDECCVVPILQQDWRSDNRAAEIQLKSKSVIYKCCCRTSQRFLPGCSRRPAGVSVLCQRHPARHGVHGRRGCPPLRCWSCSAEVQGVLCQPGSAAAGMLRTRGRAGRDGAVAPTSQIPSAACWGISRGSRLTPLLPIREGGGR